MIYGQRKANMIPTGQPTANLVPDLALIDGLGDAMAATLLGSPYLAGSPTLVPGTATKSRYFPPRDISALGTPAPNGVFSAPTIAALTWQLALTNTGITAPGTSADWVNIIPINLLKYYTLLTPFLTTGNESVPSDCPNLYVQLARLQEAQASGDNSNLAAYFPDNVLYTLCAPFNVPWTTALDADNPRYTSNWGVDPNTLMSPLPGLTLSMAQAQQINGYYVDGQGSEQVTTYYPNNSRPEVVYTLFALSRDTTYHLKLTAVPSLPAGASLEVVVDGLLAEAYLFPGGTPPQAFTLTLKGDPADLTTPAYHTFRIRLLSPSILLPDTQVTVQLEKANVN